MTECWHCKNTNRCTCIFCGFDAIVGDIATRQAGKCGFCEARAFHDRHRSILEAYDTTDRRNWEYHPPADGNKKRMIFIPLKDLP